MKLSKKLAAIALAAGISLTACGSSTSPYAQGKAWAIQDYNNGDIASIVTLTPLASLQQWCAENNSGENASWNSGCEAGYFQNHSSDHQSWGSGASAAQSTPSSGPTQAPAGPTEPALVTVPNVVNVLYTNALETLQGDGFNVIVKRVAPNASVGADNDDVTAQTPAGGTSASGGPEVTIHIPNG